MIFVTVGSFRLPFDRLVEHSASIATATDERVVVQRGGSRVSPFGCEVFDFVTMAEFEEHVRSARIVVSHAGVGSAAASLRNGRRPILVPRLRLHGENIDDHQLAFARRLEALGLAAVVTDISTLVDAIRSHRSALPGVVGLSPDLRFELDKFVTDASTPRPGFRARARAVRLLSRRQHLGG
jgi:UDP-N-acetylglucosamine transferase subunit ALG13